MNDFFGNISLLEQTYWYAAIIGSGIFLIIFILTFIGGGDTDMDADIDDSDGGDDGGVWFQFFTFKNVIAFRSGMVIMKLFLTFLDFLPFFSLLPNEHHIAARAQVLTL